MGFSLFPAYPLSSYMKRRTIVEVALDSPSIFPASKIVRYQTTMELFETAWLITRYFFTQLILPLTLLLLFNRLITVLVFFSSGLLDSSPKLTLDPVFEKYPIESTLVSLSSFLLLILFMGLSWLSLDYWLKTGIRKNPFVFIPGMIPRLFHFLLSCLIFGLSFVCGILFCLLPGLYVFVIWVPGPFITLSEKAGVLKAFRIAGATTRVTRPLTGKNGRSLLFWLIGGIMLVQLSISTGLALTGQAVTLLLYKNDVISFKTMFLIQQAVEVPSVFINAVVYIFTLVGVALVYHQGKLLREGTDLFLMLDRLQVTKNSEEN